MAFSKGAKIDPTENEDNNPLYNDEQTVGINNRLPDIVQRNPNIINGKRNRQTIIWRVPGMGFVQMYINPQQMNIQYKKIVKQQRTKGGYVIQYWGEELIIIKISGTTGSSGIEGINILRKVYRAEQNAFKQVEQTLADRYKKYTSGSLISGLVSQATNSSISNVAGNLIDSIFGGTTNQSPLPTLGSLAVSVELFHQGEVFKGYFDSFDTDESVQNGVGIFKYNLTFIALGRRGYRSNFMPWHRSPATLDENNNPIGYNRADTSSVPLSFNGEED